MATATLVQYDSSTSEDEAGTSAAAAVNAVPYIPPKALVSSALLPKINATPFIVGEEKFNCVVPLDKTTKEVSYNPRYEVMCSHEEGPAHPYKTDKQNAEKNMLTGFVEEGHINDFQFENQRRTFVSYGYAEDPTVSTNLIGCSSKAVDNEGQTVFEKTKQRPGDKRKRLQNRDAGDVEGYLGPWGKFVDEEEVSKPGEEHQEYLAEYLAKRAKNKKKPDDTPMEEKSTLHLQSDKDYQGRSFLLPPQDVGGVSLRPDAAPPKRCFVPKKLLHEWTGAHAKGVSAIRLFPGTGHLLLSAGMDDKIKLWELYGHRRLVRSYLGHRQAVKDITFNNSGSHFLSSSYDRSIKMWDTETGQVTQRFPIKKVAICLKFNPDDDKQNLFLAGCGDKKILCFDTRTAEVVQQYDRHMGAVNSVTFVDNNRRFVSTSDDKSLRVWEWDVPVDFIHLADPTMHSMPSVNLSPNGKWLLCQSLDNQIVVFNALGSFKRMRKKVYRGHMVAGYSCGLDLSPDMTYLISGDGDGKLFLWNFKTTRVITRWQAHSGPCVSALWLPHETSKVVTSGWDGVIKLWD